MSRPNRRVVWFLSSVFVVVVGLAFWLIPRMAGSSRNVVSTMAPPQTDAPVNPASGGNAFSSRGQGVEPKPLDGEPADPSLVRGTLRSLRLSEPDHFEALTVAAVFASRSQGGRPVLTLAEAIKQKAVVIQELPTKQVPAVRITLTKDVPVLCQQGDVITGGDQDRCFKRDILLTEKGETREIPVYCVEPGRWHGNGRFDGFYCPANNLAQVNVKQELLEAAGVSADGQGEVWSKVRSNLSGVSAHVGGASSIARVETGSGVSTAREKYGDHFAKFAEAHADAVGVAFIAGDQILSIEIFADHRSLAAKWPMLLDAAVVDALQVAEAKQLPSKAELQAFLDSAARSNVRRHTPIGAGDEYSVATPEAVGSLLFERGRLLHARLVPQDEIRLKHEPARAGMAAEAALKLVY